MIILNDSKVYIGQFMPDEMPANSVAVNRLVTELLNLGYIMEPQLIRQLNVHPDQAELIEKLLDHFGVGRMQAPMYPHWRERHYHSYGDLIIQVASYIFEFNATQLWDDRFHESLYTGINPADFKVIELADVFELYNTAMNLAEMKIPLVGKDLNLLVEILQVIDLSDIKFTIRENKIVTAASLKLGDYEIFKEFNFSPGDVLRYYAYKTDSGYLALPSVTKFKSFKRKARGAAFGYLNRFDVLTLCEAMSHNKKLWYRFSSAFHPEDYKHHENVWLAFNIAVHESPVHRIPVAYNLVKASNGRIEIISDSQRVVYRSFESLLDAAIKSNNPNKTIDLLLSKPGVFANRVLSLVNLWPGHTDYIINNFNQILGALSFKKLLTLASLPNNKVVYKVYNIKGYIYAGEPVSQNVNAINRIRTMADGELTTRLRQFKHVAVHPMVADWTLPLDRHGSNTTLGRGSRFTLEGRFMQVFANWTDSQVDIDLGAVLYDTDFNQIDYCDYTNQVIMGVKHSGDYVNGPASEYVQIDLDQVRGRWLLVSIMSFRNIPFDDMTLKVGWLNNKTNTIVLNEVAFVSELKGAYKANAFLLIDLVEYTATWLDYGLEHYKGLQTIRTNADILRGVVMGAVGNAGVAIWQFANYLSEKVDVTDRPEPYHDAYIHPDGQGDGVAYSKVVEYVSDRAI